jgi:hypothetical protein
MCRPVTAASHVVVAPLLVAGMGFVQDLCRPGRPVHHSQEKHGGCGPRIAWHFAWYNCRIHKTLRVTPAMEAGITARAWDLADLLT